MEYLDKILTCYECGTTHAFSASKQESFYRRHLTHMPKRCPDCQVAGIKGTQLTKVKITN